MHAAPTTVRPEEVTLLAIRAQGAGGQSVNKVSSAVHLRFDIRASSLPDEVKERLLAWPDHRVTRHGVVVIKAQEHRSQELNRAEAMERLQALVDEAAAVQRPRKPTRPTKASKQRRLQAKVERGAIKRLRGSVHDV